MVHYFFVNKCIGCKPDQYTTGAKGTLCRNALRTGRVGNLHAHWDLYAEQGHAGFDHVRGKL